MPRIARPEPHEYAPFYAAYLARVPEEVEPADLMHRQIDTMRALVGGLSEVGALARYAPGKWSVKEVVGHLSDAERVFAYRLLRLGRGDETPLPAFDENAYVPAGEFDRRPMADLLDEWVSVRRATLALVAGLPAAAWSRSGTVSGRPISARAIGWIIPGHVEHHLAGLRERYGLGR
ncbi:MAG TPA: DinB family protein [Vicinamibacterales bacterium]|nr:DinB family protein [Vicinamibacterales bacterium]